MIDRDRTSYAPARTQRRGISHVQTVRKVRVIAACMESTDVGVHCDEVFALCVCLFVHLKPEGVLEAECSVRSFFDCLCVWDASVPCRLNSIVCSQRVGPYGRRVLLRVSPLDAKENQMWTRERESHGQAM